MREAAAAVALSPDASAAELLGRLLLEPPADGSPEGDAISEASDVAEIRAQARVASLSFLAIPLFLPMLAWLGYRDYVVPTVIAAVSIVQSAQAWAAANNLMRARLWVWTSYALNIVILAFFTRIFGVAIAVPGMVLTLVAAGASIPGLRAWWVVPMVLTSTVFGPALLEATGLLARTVSATGDALVVTSTVVHLPRGPTLIVLAIHTVVLLFVGVNYGRQLTRVNREARLRLRAQAWHLEQIVDSR
jgi:hypothetical protein